jgi:hypothetical protein
MEGIVFFVIKRIYSLQLPVNLGIYAKCWKGFDIDDEDRSLTLRTISGAQMSRVLCENVWR